MNCEVEFTDEFHVWWDQLGEDAQVAVAAYVSLLEEFGVGLGYPYFERHFDSQKFANA
jgi:hypothetical protein